MADKEAPAKTPTKTTPEVEPQTKPEPSRRYNPIPQHCPAQKKRGGRRTKKVFEP